MDETVSMDQLRALSAVGGVRAVRIIGKGDGFEIRVVTSVGESTLFESEGKRPRRWKRADTVLGFLKNEYGIFEATVHFEGWTPKPRKQV